MERVFSPPLWSIALSPVRSSLFAALKKTKEINHEYLDPHSCSSQIGNSPESNTSRIPAWDWSSSRLALASRPHGTAYACRPNASTISRLLCAQWVQYGPILADLGGAHLNAGNLGGTSLESLIPYADQLLVVNGLDNHAGSAQGDGPGDHARGTSTFLTCVHPRKHASEVSLGVSVDQMLAQHYAGQTRFSSVEIGCEGGGNAGACDSGYSCAYQRNISWQDAQTPLPKETNPRLLFQRLFGGFDPSLSGEVRDRAHRRRMSVLDFVLDDAQRLQRRLGQEDRRRLDDYMTSVRSVETRLEEVQMPTCNRYPDGSAPAGSPADRGEYASLMLDMLTDAMRCDLTRAVLHVWKRRE